MKVEITGVIHAVGEITATKNGKGFVQQFTIMQPETRDELDRVTSKEKFYQINVWDRDKSGKFITAAKVGQKVTIKAWLSGERTIAKDGKTSFWLKLNLL